MALTPTEDKQIRSWFRNSKYNRIVRLLEQKKPSERDQNENFVLGTTYLILARSQHDIAKLKKGLALLNDLSYLFRQTPQWNETIGLAELDFERYTKALLYFEQALKLKQKGEDTSYLKDMIKECKEKAVGATFKTPFENRVKNAWLEFEKREAEFINILEKDVDGTRTKELENKCEAVLNIAFSSVDFNIYKKGDRPQLMLWGIGGLMLQYEMQYFKDHAPQSILNKWEIGIGEVTIPQEQNIPMMQDAFTKDAKIYIDEKENGIFLISFYSPSCSGIKELNEIHDFRLMAALALAGVTNTVIYEKFVVLENLLSEPRHQPYLLLADFSDYLNEYGINKKTDTADILNKEATFRPTKLYKKAGKFYGTTKCMKLFYDTKERLQGEEASLESNGATFGWFSYSLKCFTGEEAEKERREYKEALKKCLYEKAGKDAFKIISDITITQYDMLA